VGIAVEAIEDCLVGRGLRRYVVPGVDDGERDT
jgi:hypothetical protein